MPPKEVNILMSAVKEVSVSTVKGTLNSVNVSVRSAATNKNAINTVKESAISAAKNKNPINAVKDPKETLTVEVRHVEEEIKVKVKKPKIKREKGIEGIMALVKKHAIPCRKDKALVQLYEDPAMLWWHRPACVFAFNHPKIRSRLERLMGSNLVRLTDRKYMLKLHDRILEDYIQSMNKRIAAREAKERDREKELVLTGKIPLDKAPIGMANHPILLINNYCEKLIAERRAKIKVPKVVIPLYLYLDDTPDPPPGLSIVNGHVFRKADDLICVPPDTHLAFSTEEDVERGYMFTPDEYDKKQKYECPKVKELTNVETVEQMYVLADEIIGPLKTIKEVIAEDESAAAAKV